MWEARGAVAPLRLSSLFTPGNSIAMLVVKA